MSQRRRYNKRSQWRKTYRNYSRFNPDTERQYYQYGVVPVTADRYRREQAEEARADYYRGRESHRYGYNSMQDYFDDVRTERNFLRTAVRQYILGANRNRSEIESTGN